MRAVNTVIQAAGNLKKSEPDLEEDLQMLRAMRDSNLPKFLRDDILLFRAIIKDLFPGVTEPTATYVKLEAELEKRVLRARWISWGVPSGRRHCGAAEALGEVRTPSGLD